MFVAIVNSLAMLLRLEGNLETQIEISIYTLKFYTFPIITSAKGGYVFGHVGLFVCQQDYITHETLTKGVSRNKE